MITNIPNDRCQTYYGTSSDEKPINKYIGNGAQFIEQDTSKIYLFDEENQKWVEITNGNILALMIRGFVL